MPKSSSNALNILILSMTKAEKRAFKLYAQRGSASKHLFIKLFDLIESKKDLTEEQMIKKLKLNSQGQFSNLKRHLYDQLLNSMRMLQVAKKPNIKIREQIDKAYVLYNKGLYMQALKILSATKQLCHKYGADLSLLMILEIEKNIHSRHITRLKDDEFDNMIEEVNKISLSVSYRVKLTNLKIIFHKKYIEKGHVKNKEELSRLKKIFKDGIEGIDYKKLRVIEKIYYCQCYVWYNYVINDFKNCQKYAMRWVELFKDRKELPSRDYNLFLRGYHYVLTSAYFLNDAEIHIKYLTELEQFRKSTYKKFNHNNRIFSFLYVHTARLNQAFLTRDFSEGIKAIPNTLSRLKRYENHLDQHKVMVLHFKIAWTYIAEGSTQKALPYLEGIINLQKNSLREDIQSYSRLMHLMALFDLDKYEQVLKLNNRYKYYFKQAKELNELQKACIVYFQKVCNAPLLDRKEIHQSFHLELIEIRKNKFEHRAFGYLDILYWVEKYI